MNIIKSIIILYLYYLAIDGMLRFWKLFAIISEFGFILALRALFHYLRNSFDKTLLSLINHFRVERKVKSFADILLYPTRIIDFYLKRLTFCCVMAKAQKSGLSMDELQRAMWHSLLWFSDVGMATWPNKIPILGPIVEDSLFIIEYHLNAILKSFPEKSIIGMNNDSYEPLTKRKFRKDIFGESYLIKLFRLLIIDIVVGAIVYTAVYKLRGY